MKASFDWFLHFVSSLFYADVQEKISTWDKVKELARAINNDLSLFASIIKTSFGLIAKE